ncbi:hypothetical protein ABT186_25010 [Streptomyces sp. NPDC001634]|uniref:hypothetical protein n=1 Tax=Streptomyces sp. NPDC001634 TaxID=3154390 RepID=UPI0033258258
MTDTPEDNGRSRDLTRRTVLVAGGTTAVAVGLAGALAVDASAEADTTADTTADTCYTLTSETVEGPYSVGGGRRR